MAHLSLSLLGPFRAALDGQPITSFESAKVRALLAYLAVEADQPHSREALAGLLWPDYPDRSALSNLRYALSNLREAIGDRQADPPFLGITRETLQFNTASNYTLDLDGLRDLQDLAIDRLEQIVSLQCGLFLEGFSCDSAPFEEWTLFKREQIGQQALAALRRLAGHHEQCGNYERAITYARRQLELEPWDEQAHQQLMRVFALSGQRSMALAQYETCRRLLRQELGVEPSQETVALYESICAGEVSRDARASKRIDKARALTNVPVPLTSFVGRLREMEEVKQSLSSLSCPARTREEGKVGVRLLTLTGSGGCGKTRLAIEVARDFAGDDSPSRPYQDGVWWVDLAPLNDPALVPQAIATVFALHESRDASLTTTLANYLCGKDLLLVLDNCEHLIDACARLAETLLSTCPNLHILATSREVLGLTGELTWRVPNLALPDAVAGHLTSEELMRYDAVRLFVERAEAVAPNWRLDRNASAVVRICSRLDGIPLAIELAAARLKILAAEQIAARLDDRFHLLTDGSRMALPRHRTLKGAIDWSYELLSDRERALLRRLAVFAGGWTLEAAEAICPCMEIEPCDVLDLLTHLVDKSLVVVEPRQNTIRYRLLETIRHYAYEKLNEAGEIEPVQVRHLGFYTRLVAEAEPKLLGPDQQTWLNQFELEHDNLRAALEFSQREKGQVEAGLQIAGGLVRFWATRGYFTEGRMWLKKMLAQSQTLSPTLVRAKAFNAAAYLAYLQGDYAEARSLNEDGLEIGRAVGDLSVIASAVRGLGTVAQSQGDFALARQQYEESLALCHDAGDQWGASHCLSNLGLLAWHLGDVETARACCEQCLALRRELKDEQGIAYTLHVLGELAWSDGRHAEAESLYEESLAIKRKLDDKWGIAYLLDSLAMVARYQGDVSRARALFVECLLIFRDLGSKRGTADMLYRLASIAATQGQFQPAAQLLGAESSLRHAINAPLPPVEHEEYEHWVTYIRAQVGEDVFQSSWTTGSAMPLAQAIQYALDVTT
jgi:predicted ATPase/DNA-binding SARP family transcriptional activator